MADEPSNEINEVVDLVKAYAQQELVDPLRVLGKFIGAGIAGAVCIGLGIMMLAIGALRLLQSELADVFDGNWAFAPYLIVAIVAIGVAALFANRIPKDLDPEVPDAR